MWLSGAFLALSPPECSFTSNAINGFDISNVELGVQQFAAFWWWGTFVVQRIRPRRWWEAERARKAAHWALGIWFTLLCVLAVLVYFSRAMH
jgi:hypothetical protein